MYILQLCRSMPSSVIQDSKRVQDLLEVEDMIYCLDFNAFCLGKIWECPEFRLDVILYPKLMLILIKRALGIETSIRSSVTAVFGSLCVPSMPASQAPPLSQPKTI